MNWKIAIPSYRRAETLKSKTLKLLNECSVPLEKIFIFVADEIAGPDGPLAEYGLVADPELAKTQSVVADETVLGSGS